MSLLSIVHVITGLNTGGAETMLYKLLSHMDRMAFESKVVSLTDIGSIGKKIQALGIQVMALGMRRGVPNPSAIVQLVRWLHRDSPDLVQTWMYHADLIGGIATKLTGGIPVVWNIRHTSLDLHGNKVSTIWTAKACALLSRFIPTRIVCCSEVSRKVHRELGYASDKIVVIPNGFDLEAFMPNPVSRQSVRQELSIPDEALLIGLVGRFDPQKDHRNFIQAAALLCDQRPDVYFLLCGEDVTWKNPELVGWIETAGIRDRCHLLGRREDIPRLFASLDINTSSSYSEGFPNVIGESMTCGIPCVVTDAGDSAGIVGDTGFVVSPKDAQALADAWHKMIVIGLEGRRRLGLAARQRVEEYFSLTNIVVKYQALYEEIVATCAV